MSADDFQTRYASVMESMVRSAVAETTKLFETMVDDLKAEISRIKKENEDLKSRCNEFENAINHPINIRESELGSRLSIVADKRDTAIQCDLVPLQAMLAEHSQSQQGGCRGMEQYVLKEQNHEIHEEGNSQMAHVKQEVYQGLLLVELKLKGLLLARHTLKKSLTCFRKMKKPQWLWGYRIQQ
ncbi:hypothetical protein LDENG_00047650 [Lucifuga dentata]|nr:hypothetical protein LDENG_00047650 [Lucifuga dentata]